MNVLIMVGQGNLDHCGRFDVSSQEKYNELAAVLRWYLSDVHITAVAANTEAAAVSMDHLAELLPFSDRSVDDCLGDEESPVIDVASTLALVRDMDDDEALILLADRGTAPALIARYQSEMWEYQGHYPPLELGEAFVINMLTRKIDRVPTYNPELAYESINVA